MEKLSLTQEKLKELLIYDPESGLFYWNERPREAFKNNSSYNNFLVNIVGKVAGSFTSDDYIRIPIDRFVYKAHQLAWLYVHGSFPEEGYVIDHRDHNRSNNMITNLRSITIAENSQNRSLSRSNKTGVKGVYFDKRKGKYASKLIINGVKYCKYSDTVEEAIQKRYDLEIEHHVYRATPTHIETNDSFSEHSKKRMEIPLNLEKFMDEL